MQRLPPHRIQRAQELGEIGLEENPAAAGLGTGDEAALGAGANFLGMHVQERGGLIEVERSFSDSPRAEHSQSLRAGAACTGLRFARTCTDRVPPIVGHVRAFGNRVVDVAARYTLRCIPAEGTSGGPRYGPDVICLSCGSSRGRYRPQATRGRRFAATRSAVRENASFEGSDRTVSAL